MPVIVLVGDSAFRDPDVGDPTPGGCPADAGAAAAVRAIEARRARVATVDVGDGTASSDMRALTLRAGSLYDAEGADVFDDAAVLRAARDGASLTAAACTLIEGLLHAATFSEARLEAEDPGGFLVSATPLAWDDLRPSGGDSLEFKVALRGAKAGERNDRLYACRIRLVGDGVVGLGRVDLLVRVPAR
jgi:hypothetical protein